jgi:hypothetical protein
MEQNNYNPEGILAFSARRNITTLFKEFLDILEDLSDDHNEALNKLVKTLPPDSQKQLYLADHFTNEKMEQLRKRILSKGNDAIRTIENEINKFDVKFKQ